MVNINGYDHIRDLRVEATNEMRTANQKAEKGNFALKVGNKKSGRFSNETTASTKKLQKLYLEMRERLIGFCHTVCIFFLFESTTLTL